MLLCSSKKDLLWSQVTDHFFSSIMGLSGWAMLCSTVNLPVWGCLQTCPMNTHRTHLSPGMSIWGPLWLIHLSLMGLGLTLQNVNFFKILSFLLKPLQSIPQLRGSQTTKQEASWSNYNHGLHVDVGCSLRLCSLWRTERKVVPKPSSSSASSLKPSRTSTTQVPCCWNW